MANTIAKNAGIVSARIVDLTGLLKTNQIGNLPNSKYKYTSFTIKDYLTQALVLEFDPNIQRMYLYNDIDNENVQHYLIGLIKTIVVKDLSIFLVDLKKYNVYDYYENLIRSNIDEIELSKFLFNRDQSLYLIELAK